MTFCQATVALPHTCAFCGRDLPDGTAARLRALRTGLGLSTAAVAAQLGLARTTAYEWEVARRSIPPERRSALAALLHVPPELLGTVPRRTPPAEESQMEPEDTSAHTPPCAASTSPETESASALPARRQSVQFTIELACLLCGRDIGVLESETWPTYRPTLFRQPAAPTVSLTDWRRLRCGICGGAAMPTEVTCRLVRNESPVDWATERPRRGRPPKWLIAQRANGSSAA